MLAVHSDGRARRERSRQREERGRQHGLAADSRGYGGPVAIDPKNTNNWYVNDQPGVAIYLLLASSALHAI